MYTTCIVAGAQLAWAINEIFSSRFSQFTFDSVRHIYPVIPFSSFSI